MMFCPACREPIDDNPINSALLLPSGAPADTPRLPHHFACVPDPSELTPAQFQKWAIWAIEQQRLNHEPIWRPSYARALRPWPTYSRPPRQ